MKNIRCLRTAHELTRQSTLTVNCSLLAWRHIMFSLCRFLKLESFAAIDRPLGGILYFRETAERCALECGFENVTRPSTDIALRSKWVKFQFRVNNPLKTLKINALLTCYHPFDRNIFCPPKNVSYILLQSLNSNSSF